MTVLSMIPGVGGALVWLQAAVILISAGELWRGGALFLFCALVVGSVDNVLRPRLVGQDTKMHELLIFFSTLGGLMFFGAMGFILGPMPGGALRHRVGNVRHRVPQRARRTGIGSCRRGSLNSEIPAPTAAGDCYGLNWTLPVLPTPLKAL